MENTTKRTIDLLPKALERMYDQLDEMRILVMLEESNQEAMAGSFIDLDEGFERLRVGLREPEVKANVV